MHFVSRRQAMKLASSFAAAFPLLKGSASRAQVKPGTEATVFEMADFVKGAPDADAAFARALAAISKSAGEANKAGKPVPIVFNLEKNATYKIKQPLLFKQLSDFELNGNEAARQYHAGIDASDLRLEPRHGPRSYHRLRSAAVHARDHCELRPCRAADHGEGRPRLSRRRQIPGQHQ